MIDPNIRKEGYYWVKYLDAWFVAEYDNGKWYFTGIERSFCECDLEDVKEEKIDNAK